MSPMIMFKLIHNFHAILSFLATFWTGITVNFLGGGSVSMKYESGKPFYPESLGKAEDSIKVVAGKELIYNVRDKVFLNAQDYNIFHGVACKSQ